MSLTEDYWYVINHARNEVEIMRAFDLLRSNNIEPILIKGLAVAIKYPGLKRFYTDIDLCVSPSDFPKARSLLKGSNIDLHEGLRNLDLVPWEDLFINSKLIEIGGGKIRVLRDEDHLRVLCVHWLIDGGVRKERLLDIYYVLKSNPNFDWERFLGNSETRRKWMECVIGLTSFYYGLELKGTPFEDASKRIPRWVFKALEREWSFSFGLLPLHVCLKRKDVRGFFKQLMRRFPPNPLQAMVEVEGELADSRVIVFFYQLESLFLRFGRFIGRLFWYGR
jgi:hypothetical protein